MTDKKKLIKWTMFCDDLFMIAKRLHSEYRSVLNAILTVEGEDEYNEFKAWVDKKLNDFNESWNEQYDAMLNGASDEEINAIAEKHTKKQVSEEFDD